MNDGITYKSCATGEAVYLGKRRVGTIVYGSGYGYRYIPCGASSEMGEVMSSVAAVKRSLEAE
jgi:hypothetical protein